MDGRQAAAGRGSIEEVAAVHFCPQDLWAPQCLWYVLSMSENVQTAMFEILKKIQGDVAAFRGAADKRFEQVDSRLERVETLVRKQRRDGAAMLVMMRSAAGDFEERLAAVEQQIALLDASEH
jgi:hypothetical protein